MAFTFIPYIQCSCVMDIMLLMTSTIITSLPFKIMNVIQYFSARGIWVITLTQCSLYKKIFKNTSSFLLLEEAES